MTVKEEYLLGIIKSATDQMQTMMSDLDRAFAIYGDVPFYHWPLEVDPMMDVIREVRKELESLHWTVGVLTANLGEKGKG